MNAPRMARTRLSALLGLSMLLMTALPPRVAADDPAWRGEYYGNRWLSGAPTLVRDDPVLDFNWGAGSPDPRLPADGFSSRWTRSVRLDGGRYRFAAQSDDGVRLFVDGALLIDEWQDQNSPTFTAETNLAPGDHALRVEYYENAGGAQVRVTWSRIDAPPPGLWRGEYFANPWLSGAPSLVRDDAAVNFDWGVGSPAPGLPADRFSARWTRTTGFDAGRYRFSTETDDGVRLFIDGRLVVDAWRDQPPTIYRVELDLGAGNHTVRMEYYESYGGALARLGWERIEGGPGPGNTWRGEYFANRSLSGAPTFSRLDPKVSFDWGLGSPDTRIPDDNFSIRWTRTVQFSSGRYRFTTVTDDGLRLLIDGRTVIDQWHDMGRETYTADVQLSTGPHTIQMDYYEAAGAASAVLSWVKISDPRRDVGNIVTCARQRNSWVMVYRQENGGWLNVNPKGFSPISNTGYLKLDGMWVDAPRYGSQGHPYKVELWADNRLIRSVGDTSRGEPAFRVRAFADSFTPWGCPAP